MIFEGKGAGAAQKGAALVEYVVLMAALIIALPAIALLSDDTERLFDAIPGLTPPPGGPQEVFVPGCVSTGQCKAPPELIESCIEEYGYGARCGDFPIAVIDPPTGERFVIPIAQDPVIQWATSDQNEDYPLKIYANTGGNGSGNTAALVSHPIIHPAANFCSSRGMYLPAIDQLKAMSSHVEALQLMDMWYHSSSQYWSPGGYTPVPYAIAGNFVRVYNMALGDSAVNKTNWAYPGTRHHVRCAYGVVE